jgi:Flp pilus assembly protein TadG
MRVIRSSYRAGVSQGIPSSSSTARERRRRRSGAAAVEFAVVGLAFFPMVLGIVEIGRGIMVQHLMLNAARQGCRTGILPGNSNTEVTTAVTNVLQPLGISNDTISVQVNDGVKDAKYANTGDEVTVKVSVPVSSVTWVPVPQYLNGSISAQYTMRKQ